MNEPVNERVNERRSEQQSPHDNSERMSRLALEFPTLHKGVPGILPWNAARLDQWLATSGAVTAGSRCAGQFLLYVWNPETEWRSGAFSLREAYGRMDPTHWKVVEEFVQHPYFP